jgi:hypothetical protein
MTVAGHVARGVAVLWILKGLFLLFLMVSGSLVTFQALLPVVGFYPAALGAGIVFYLAVLTIDRLRP